MDFKTFEDRWLSSEEKWRCALSNVAYDALKMPIHLKKKFSDLASRSYPGYALAEPELRLLSMNLLLPGRCNARCPSVCYTDWTHWRPHPEDLTWAQLEPELQTFKRLGGKMIRVVGNGEPTLNPYVLNLCQWAGENQVYVIVFSNGVSIDDGFLGEYAHNRFVAVYLKHWSDNADIQDDMVQPKGNYVYEDGEFGPASAVFYRLWKKVPDRVGLQIMIARPNHREALQIIQGPKRQLPLFVEPFIAAGAGLENQAWKVEGVESSKHCERPTRSSYLAVLNSHGYLQPGTFVQEGAVRVVGQGLEKVWASVFSQQTLFFTARYESTSCFCEAMANKARRLASRSAQAEDTVVILQKA